MDQCKLGSKKYYFNIPGIYKKLIVNTLRKIVDFELLEEV